MNSLLSQLNQALLSALNRQINPSGRLFDPLDEKPTPTDHYGQCAVALALACDARGSSYVERALLCVNYWSQLPAASTGHQPFNRLLLRLLQGVLSKHHCDTEALGELDKLAKGCALAARYPSNNWALLAQIVRIIEAPDDGADAATDVFCKMLNRWTTPAGGFIDFPNNPRPGARISTPIAYHHKALLLTALAVRLRPHPALFKHLRRLFDWLVHCWDPAGFAGGLGRSSHALFGDACLVGALILIGQDSDESDCLNSLATRLHRQFRDDGLLWLDPFGRDEANANWDTYMHLSVYNAWFAAIVGVCRVSGPIELCQLRKYGIKWRGNMPGVFHDEQAGVLFARQPKGMNILFSTRGQLQQASQPDVADLRYAGGIPMHATDVAGQMVIRPPTRHAGAKLMANPTLADPVQVIVRKNVLYGVTDFEKIEVRLTEDTLHVKLRGHPTALLKPTPKGLLGHFVASIDWRFLDGRIGRWQALHRPQLSDVNMFVEWDLRLDQPKFERRIYTTNLWGRVHTSEDEKR